MIESFRLQRSNATQLSRGDDDLAEKLKHELAVYAADSKSVYVRWITTIATYDGNECLVDKLQYLAVSTEIENREGPGVFAFLDENDTWENSRVMTTRRV